MVKIVCFLSPWVLFNYFVLTYLQSKSQSGQARNMGLGSECGPISFDMYWGFIRGNGKKPPVMQSLVRGGWGLLFFIPTPSRPATHKCLLGCCHVQRYCRDRRNTTLLLMRLWYKATESQCLFWEFHLFSICKCLLIFKQHNKHVRVLLSSLN